MRVEFNGHSVAGRWGPLAAVTGPLTRRTRFANDPELLRA
jgi:hypothetical protein